MNFVIFLLFLCQFFSNQSAIAASTTAPIVTSIRSISQTAYEASENNILQGSWMCGFFAAFNAEHLLNTAYNTSNIKPPESIIDPATFNQWLNQRQDAIGNLNQAHNLHEAEITSLLTKTDTNFYEQHCSITELLSLEKSCFLTPEGTEIFVPFDLESPLLTAIRNYRQGAQAHAIILQVDLTQFGIAPHWVVIFLEPDESIVVIDSLNLCFSSAAVRGFIYNVAERIAYLFSKHPLLSQEELQRVHSLYWTDATEPTAPATEDVPSPQPTSRQKKIFYNKDDYNKALRGDKNLAHANLRGAILCECDLEKADFSDADLRGARFIKANLSKARFTKAKLDGANFTQANLSQAIFDRARLNSTLFARSQLQHAIFKGVNRHLPMEGPQAPVRFDFADLTGAKIANTHLPDALFAHAILDHVVVTKSSIPGLKQEQKQQAAEAEEQHYMDVWKRRKQRYMRAGCSLEDTSFLLLRAQDQSVPQEEREAIIEALDHPGQKRNWKSTEELEYFNCKKTLDSCTGNALQLMLHQKIVTIARDSMELHKTYVTTRWDINKILHVQNLTSFLDSFLSLACRNNQNFRSIRTYKLIALCTALKDLQALLGEFFDEHQPSTSNGIYQITHLGIIDQDKEFGKDIATTINTCHQLNVNYQRFNREIENLATTIAALLTDILISYYPNKNKLVDIVINHCPHILMFYELTSNHKKYTIPIHLRGMVVDGILQVANNDYDYEVIFDLIKGKLHNISWRNNLERESSFNAGAYEHSKKLQVDMPPLMLTKPISMIFRSVAQRIRAITADERTAIEEAEWLALRTSYVKAGHSIEETEFLLQRARNEDTPYQERNAIILLFDNPTNREPFIQTWYLDTKVQAYYPNHAELATRTGTTLQLALHQQAVDLAHNEADIYEKYVESLSNINKIWHVKNLHKFLVILLNATLHYDQKKHLLNAYDLLACCRRIRELEDTLGKFLYAHQTSAGNALWDIFQTNTDYAAEFGKDINKRNNEINQPFIQKLDKQFEVASSLLCNIIERNCSRNKTFKTFLRKNKNKTNNVNTVIDILNKQKIIPTDSLQEVQDILDMETCIAAQAPEVSLHVTKPLTFLLTQVGERIQRGDY